WRDSFLLRQVDGFAAWPPARRESRLVADSLRREGNAAYGRDGPAAASAIWSRGLAVAARAGDTAAMAALLGNLGASALARGRLDSAEATLERAAALALAAGDRRTEANAVTALAGVSQDRGDLAAAHEGYSRALALHERIGDARGAAADHNNLGLVAQAGEDLGAARRHFETALAMNRADGRDGPAATNLVNLAALASLAGEFARARAFYQEALGIWRTLDLEAEQASALHGLGQLEMRRGDYRAADTVLVEAREIYRRSGHVTEQVEVRRALASTRSATGDLQGALLALREAERLADSAGALPRARAGVALVHADVAAQLNDFAAAERLYRRAAGWYREARLPAAEAEAQQGLAALMLQRRDAPAAETLLRSALRAQEAAGYRRSAGRTMVELGKVAAQRGDTAAARLHLKRAVGELEKVGDSVSAAAATGERAALEAVLGRPAAATALYRSALALLGGRLAPEVSWRLHAGLGRALAVRGSADEAARELRAAVDAAERPGRSLASAERRSGFMADKWTVYADLARLEQGRGRPGTAFELSESLRAREMLELLGRGRIAPSARAPADLAAREQDLRRQIAVLTVRDDEPRGSPLRGPAAPPPSPAAREALRQAQQAYAELMIDLRERAPVHAALVSSRVAQWQEVARRLGPDEALIEYLMGDSASVAFLVTGDTLVTADLGIRRGELAPLVEFARRLLEPRPAAADDSLWRAPLRRLHRHLVEPLEATGRLAGKRRLILVPHAELHYLPFAALLETGDGGRFLVQRYELAEAPSASVWLALEERGAGAARDGLLAFAPRAEALPGSRREVESIVRLMGGSSRAVIGSDATEEAFRRAAPSPRVLHLATFGVLNKHNPLFSHVELAPGGGRDGRLEVHEIFGLALSADLVVLSACQTGVGSGALSDVPAGDDWVGLTRAFLHAGARHVVATLWPVEDWPTASLMERFYGEYAKVADPVRALALAQRAMLEARATSHPFAWAGFIITGGTGAGSS
ncbi:MAG TPA: CHAT domain-containing protein, partial [Gemmatimonadales bacterium]|nr:CHAT domain-containing protein [Gemmatimonadales bacterium]